ncbi:MAG: hypothetical protein KAJ51_05045, partial [Thermoplasmata archaeon]|nr:hypothetical protein [Thermoplasmata archaeon]
LSFMDTDGAVQGQTFLAQIVASDIDIERGEADTLIFSANTTRADVLTDPLDPLKINLSFTPDNTDVLKKKFFVKIELRDIDDGSVDDYVEIIIEIRNINDPPSIVSFTHMESDNTYNVIETEGLKYIAFSEDDNCAYEDQWYNLTINGIDPDPDDVIAYDSDDSRFLIKPNLDDKFSGIITFKPTQAEVGTIEFNISAVDSEGAKDRVLVRILVQNTNNIPIAKILKPTRREFDVGETIDFQGNFYDDDLPQDSHTFTWISDWDGELGDQIDLTDIELSTGVHEITFTVEDAEGAKDIVTITITVGGEDTDRDGLPDDWEEKYFDGLEYYNAEDDPDNDRLTNLEELNLKSDPMDPDSPVPQSKESDSEGIDEGLMIGIIVVIIIIIIVLIIAFLLIRKKRAAPEGAAALLGGAVPTQPIARDKVGYQARPVPTLDELFPEGVKEEDLRIGTPPQEEEVKGEPKKALKEERIASTGIGLPPEELRKELRRKKPARREVEDEGIIAEDDEGREKVVVRPDADEELISERAEGVAEFRPGAETSEELETDIPDSPFAGATVKEIDQASEEPIFMERESEDLKKVYGEDEELEDLEDEEE